MGGRQHDADELFWKVLGLQRAGPVLIPQETLAAAYSQEMGIRDGAPSTGFVGELCTGTVAATGHSLSRILGYYQEWGLQPVWEVPLLLQFELD